MPRLDTPPTRASRGATSFKSSSHFPTHRGAIATKRPTTRTLWRANKICIACLSPAAIERCNVPCGCVDARCNPRFDKRRLSAKTPFCDGRHIIKGKPHGMVVSVEMGLTGECHACFLFVSGSTCGETGHLRLAPLLYQGGRRTNANGRGRNCCVS